VEEPVALAVIGQADAPARGRSPHTQHTIGRPGFTAITLPRL